MKTENTNKEITAHQIWSVGETLKPHMEDFKIYYNASHEKIDVTIDGQPFEFNTYMEYVFFIKGFKFAMQEMKRK